MRSFKSPLNEFQPSFHRNESPRENVQLGGLLVPVSLVPRELTQRSLGSGSPSEGTSETSRRAHTVPLEEKETSFVTQTFWVY